MAHREERRWESSLGSGLPRRERRSGDYRAYLPDRLQGLPLALPPQTDAALARAERAVRALTGNTHDLAGIARFLLRSEAIASSQIEGIVPAARGVALAELGQHEPIPAVSEQAQLVANNVTVLHRARTALASASVITEDQVLGLHAALLPAEPRHHGIRTVQNWIGGSSYHPLEADFVPPAPEHVPALMADLLGYLNGAAHAAIVQAALTHAQFETIHPFTDGNGRVGRALIHTALTRRGLTADAILPVSLVLSTLRDDYVAGLTAYRHDAPAGSDAAHAARAVWIGTFADAVHTAATQAAGLASELAGLRGEWDERLSASRARNGMVRALRADSATALVLRDLPGTPVLTSATVQRIHKVSHVAADRALAELVDADILAAQQQRGVRYYQARDVLDLITYAERRLASTRFDTRVSPPRRPAPARPAR